MMPVCKAHAEISLGGRQGIGLSVDDPMQTAAMRGWQLVTPTDQRDVMVALRIPITTAGVVDTTIGVSGGSWLGRDKLL